MRLLLDTHIWIWAVLEPERLGKQLTKRLTATDNELWVSPVSVWELAILVERNRVRLNLDLDVWVEEVFARFPLREAPLNRQIAVESRRIELPHQDPADRFLAATAKLCDLTLVTSDERLLASRAFEHLANR